VLNRLLSGSAGAVVGGSAGWGLQPGAAAVPAGDAEDGLSIRPLPGPGRGRRPTWVLSA